MAGIGRSKLFGGYGTGRPVDVLYNVGTALWHPVGITIDWGTVTAVSGDTETADGALVKDGQKYLRYGQVMTRKTTAHAQTITVSGVPTGGSFYARVYDPQRSVGTSISIPYNAAVATTQGLLDAFFGSGATVVSGAGALPGNVQTVTLAGRLRYAVLPLMTLGTNSLTGGTSPTVAFAVSAGTDSGEWGPYDNGASDGRQTLLQGAISILNNTIVANGTLGLGLDTLQNTENVGALIGGYVWRDRVLANDSSGSLAAGPLWSALQAVLPEIKPVYGS
jgi:hypothetical protein